MKGIPGSEVRTCSSAGLPAVPFQNRPNGTEKKAYYCVTAQKNYVLTRLSVGFMTGTGGSGCKKKQVKDDFCINLVPVNHGSIPCGEMQIHMY